MTNKEKPVNTPVSLETRKLIKMKAASEGLSMLEYLENLLKEKWKNERSDRNDTKGS